MTTAAQPSPLKLLTSDEAAYHAGLAGGHISQLVAAGEIVPFATAGRRRINLFTREGFLPANEAQLRELAKPEDPAEAWQGVVETLEELLASPGLPWMVGTVTAPLAGARRAAAGQVLVLSGGNLSADVAANLRVG